MNSFVARRILLSIVLLVGQGGRDYSICINAQHSLMENNDQSAELSDVNFIRVVTRWRNKVQPVLEEYNSKGSWPDVKLDGTGKTGSDVLLLCWMLAPQCATGNRNDRYGSAYVKCLYRNCVRNRRKGEGMEELESLQLGTSTDGPYDHRGKPDTGSYNEKRGYSDIADVCIELHCGDKSPGTMVYLKCISENHCIGR